MDEALGEIAGFGVSELAHGERVTLWAMRTIGAERAHCPRFPLALADLTGMANAHRASAVLVGLWRGLLRDRTRTIRLGALTDRGVTWDEAALLAAIAAALRRRSGTINPMDAPVGRCARVRANPQRAHRLWVKRPLPPREPAGRELADPFISASGVGRQCVQAASEHDARNRRGNT